MNMGANTIKWTSLDPCLVLSESDSISFTNFEICEEKNHTHMKDILIYKAKQFIMTKTNSNRIVYIF